ncbi:MAG: AAA domain-containing protein [Prevotella sp.]|nr:AAA domain-containing protein [Prevotella sp.]
MTESPILALQQQRILLEIEYNVDKEEHKKQMEAKGLERLAKRGDVWLNVRFGRSYYNSLNQLSVEILRTQDNEIEHNFEFGRPVYIIFTEKPSNKNEKRTKSINGTVSYVDGDRMVVVVPDGTDTVGMQTASSLYVQLGFDETTYRLMFEALDRTISARGRLGYLRDLFYSNQKAETFTFAPLSFPFLNVSQERAVNEVLRAKDVAVVHGPPGTGKTTTLVEAIYETLRRENQVLVCAQSNMAVDWISEKLVDRGINVLRIGNPTKVNDKMLSFTYERRFESHPDYPQLWAIRKTIRQLRANRKRGDNSFHQKMERLKEREIELELRIRNQLFGEARVIASTLVGSANRLLDGMKFGTLFIDEAAQALEAACWIPIRRATRVILAGDHCQLPPTIKSIAAMKGGLDKTLMQRIVERKPEAVTLLKMQYRMNEDIMRFSSDWFYNGQVEAAPMVKYRGILDLDKAIEWKDTSGDASHEEFVGDNFGRINKEEAQLTLLTLAEYFVRIGRQRIIDERIDVGIISPYRAQVQYLRHLIKKTDFYKPFRKIIAVNTVDGFQGQERDIIVISMVRSNEEGQIGFLRDLRRMNVAITRARMKLLILGDSATLTRHPFYRRLKEYIDSLSETN